MSLISPLLAGAMVDRDRDRLDPRPHPRPVQPAEQVINLMAHQPGDTLPERGDPGRAVDVLMLHLDTQRPGHLAAHIEETQAPLVLLISLGGLIADLRVQ